MNKIIIWKLTKYLFYISILLSTLTLSHLIYSYLYKDFKEVPVKWWTISEAIIWNFPHLNPLLPSTNHNKYINHLLYRSLLSYDVENEKIKSGLASCDIDNLSYIECYLEDNIKWSDWTPITSADIISTFNAIKESEVNPIIWSLLTDITIEEKDWMITFSNTKKDINLLNLLFQPILSKDIIDNLWTEDINWNLSYINWIYSWRYKIISVNKDSTIWITKIILEKNEHFYNNNVYIDKIIFKLFDDKSHFLKHKNSINIFNDKDNIIGDSIPRLMAHNYTLPQFVSIFLNKDSIEWAKLRNVILNSINKKDIIADLWENNVKEVSNPFLSKINIDDKIEETDIDSILKDLWYLSKKELVNKYIKVEKETKTYSNEVKPVAKKIAIKQKELEYIISWLKNKYNFVNEGDILLKWETRDEDIESVYVNDYKLQWFKKWDKFFYYRLKESYDSIKQWDNKYKIYFEKDSKKNLKEEINVNYNTDKEKLKEIEDELFANGKEELVEIIEEIVNTDREGTNSTGSSVELSVNEKNKLEDLDPSFLYNKDLKAFTLNIAYINSDLNIKKTASIIKDNLEQKKIKVNLLPISISLLTESLRSWELKYDGLLIWINTWYFNYNLFPYFHSSQVENWYNFSNFKKLSLDILLEELKGNKLSNTKIIELEKRVLAIVKEEQVLKTLYSPILKVLVDRNIENYKLNEYIPDNIYRYDPLLKSYLLKSKLINLENKWILDFMKYIFNSLF